MKNKNGEITTYMCVYTYTHTIYINADTDSVCAYLLIFKIINTGRRNWKTMIFITNKHGVKGARDGVGNTLG